MPKAIANYQATNPDNREAPPKIPMVPFLILVILIAFGSKACYDSWNNLDKEHAILASKSKVCMGEFTEKKCNSLELSSQCKQLYDCVQAGNGDASTKFSIFMEGLSKEILTDFPFPTAMIGLLLLLQLK